MKSNKVCPNKETKKSSDIFFNQRFLQQSSLLSIDSVLTFVPKEWLYHSNEINHSFQKKLTKAKNEKKISIKKGLISDDDCSVYSDVTDPYYLPTEKELFKVLNKILGSIYNMHYNDLGLTENINIKYIRCIVLVEDLIENGQNKKDLSNLWKKISR